MGPHALDLLVERWLGDLAFLDVNHQPVVCADEANIQTLFELVPLAANHDAVPVAIRLRTRNHRRNQRRINAADSLEQIADLFVLEPELGRISDVLILASAALAKIPSK